MKSFYKFKGVAIVGAFLIILNNFNAKGQVATYHIQGPDHGTSHLLNVPNTCGAGSYYNQCDASNPGFFWNDTLPTGALIDSIVVRFNLGVECQPGTYATRLNGNIATSVTTNNWCNCTQQEYLLLSRPNKSFYVNNARNEFRLTSGGSCVGFSRSFANLSGFYAIVYIYYKRSDLALSDFTISPNPTCSGHESDVTLKITNFGPGPSPTMLLGIDMAGQSRILRNLNINLQPGRDTTITIPNLFKTNIFGNNKLIRALNADGDLNPANDTTNFILNVTPSPYGSEFVPVLPFDGRIDLGIFNYPDMTNARKEIAYEIKTPTGYTNGVPNWTVSNISTSLSGNPLPASFFNLSTHTPGSNAKLTVTFPDSYEDSNVILKIRLTSNNGCDTVITRHVYIAATVRPNFIFSQACADDPLQFTNLSTLSKGIPTYYWVFGDGSDTLQTAADPSHTYTQSGNYNVTLIGITELGFKTDTTITITVTPTPLADFKFKNACFGEPVELEDNSFLSSGILTYSWDFGDGNGDNQTKTSHQFASHGMYNVSLYVESQLGCNATISKQVQQHPVPVADFTLPATPQCFSSRILFSNSSTIPYTTLGYDWIMEDGAVYKTRNTGHLFNSAGSTDIKLVVTSEFGCQDSIIKSMLLLPTPKVDFNVVETCLYGNTLLTSTSDVTGGQNIAYTWKTGDGMMLNGSQTQYTYNALGNYNVELEIVFDNGCSNKLSKQITVNERPTAGFEVAETCHGEYTSFANTSTFVNGQLNNNWSFGDGNTSTDFNPQHQYASTGSFEVVLITNTGTSCTDTFKLMHSINEMPVCDFDWEIDWTLGYEPGKRSIKFTPANTSYNSYKWFFGNVSNSTQTSPSYKFNTDGTYEVRLVAKTAEGCECQSVQKVSATTTGLPLVETGDIRFYPNPATDYLNVEILSNNNKAMKFLILDQTGRSLQTGTLNQGNNRIELHNLANGTYYIRMTVDGMSGTYPFVIVK
jgi:PKD repeat protein